MGVAIYMKDLCYHQTCASANAFVYLKILISVSCFFRGRQKVPVYSLGLDDTVVFPFPSHVILYCLSANVT